AAHAGLLPARVEPLSRAGGGGRGRGALTDSPVPSIERRNSIRRVSPRVRTAFPGHGDFLEPPPDRSVWSGRSGNRWCSSRAKEIEDSRREWLPQRRPRAPT